MNRAVQGVLPVVLVNGERLPPDAPHVSARDRGLTLADGLFETMRARNNVVFRLERHLTRLRDGLRIMQIPEPSSIEQTVEAAVEAAGSGDLSIRLTITRGPSPGGLTTPFNPVPTLIVVANPMPQFPAATYTTGLRAIIAAGRRNSRSMSAGLKTLSYTDSVLALLEAQRAGADEAILLDEDGHCSEATASNLFVYHGDALLTPPVTCAALPGITRAAVLELADAAGIHVEQRIVGVEDLNSGSEVFLTSSLRGVAPVTTIDGRPVGSGTVGRVTTTLIAGYTNLVNRECGTA